MEMAQAIIYFVILIFSVVIHECCHALAAYRNGDDTAYLMGRLTLNPIPHLDPVGSVLLPLMLLLFHSPVMFGYAKPVPINSLKFKNYERGVIAVSLSGCAANFAFGSAAAFLSKFVQGIAGQYLLYAGFLNFFLGFFNLIPIPPLDGSRILGLFLPSKWSYIYARMERYGLFIIYIILFWVGASFIVELSRFFINLIAG